MALCIGTRFYDYYTRVAWYGVERFGYYDEVVLHVGLELCGFVLTAANGGTDRDDGS